MNPAKLREMSQIYVVTHPRLFQCPQHPRQPTRWEIPRNGIGVLCERCGAWCLVGILPRFLAPMVTP